MNVDPKVQYRSAATRSSEHRMTVSNCGAMGTALAVMSKVVLATFMANG